jgi:hypothetical protein
MQVVHSQDQTHILWSQMQLNKIQPIYQKKYHKKLKITYITH